MQLLRGDVAEGANEVATAGDGVVLRLHLGEAEVGDPDRPREIEQQVGGLHVAVQNAEVVGMFQSQGHVDDQTDNLIPEGPMLASERRSHVHRGQVDQHARWPRSRTAILQLHLHQRRRKLGRIIGPIGEGRGVSQTTGSVRVRVRFGLQYLLHRPDQCQRPRCAEGCARRIRTPVSRGLAPRPNQPIEWHSFNKLHRVKLQPMVLADAIDRHDVRVVQTRGDLGLAAEAGLLACRHPQLRAEDFQSHAAVQ